jgi:glycosyltransferase involved in cell wall biosynthesis
MLETELRKHLDLQIFEYGRKTDFETTVAKLVGRTKDLIRLRAKIATFKPDLIHHNTAFDTRAIIRDAALVWLAKRYGIPVLLKMHGSLDELFGKVSPGVDLLRNAVLTNGDCITVLSEVEMKKFLNAWPFLEGRVLVVKNIIKPEFYAVERREAEHPTVLFISRFIREKGIFELLDAIPGVLERFPTSQFVFVGSGTDAAEFDAQVKHKQLAGCVNRIDHQSNAEIATFYSCAWALVFPTHFPEGMPMVVAEAMAAGVPIITTRTNFSRSYMADGEHCLYVERKDSASLRDQMISLLGDHGLRECMSKSNRQLAQLFRADIVASEFLAIYKDFQHGRHHGERSC